MLRKDMNIFEKSVNGKSACPKEALNPALDAFMPATGLGSEYRSEKAALPEVSELDVVRHYSALSTKNFSLDESTYPLGSCTMKYNPRVNEKIASMPEFCNVHPLLDERFVQGTLEMFYDSQRYLAQICGFDAVTLQPAAGAHGEYTALLVVRKYFEKKGQKRTRIIVPDSSHGTNPASAACAGFSTQTIASDANGEVDVEVLKQALDEDVACVMITNPNTLGLFERNIQEVTRICHENGTLVYCDGANLNALMGIVRPGDVGFDLMHVNLHKTFSTPHGGGGPGAGPVCVKGFLEEFLPSPLICKDENGRFSFCHESPDTIGKVKSFYGNLGVVLKAFAYIERLGGRGLEQASKIAVLNANYLKKKMESFFDIPQSRTCMHEFVAQPNLDGLSTRDIAKRMIDYGVHPPTIYFPLIVKEAMMFEPTETESKDDLDALACVMEKIVEEFRQDPEILHQAPSNRLYRRMDETAAARKPVLKYSPENDA